MPASTTRRFINEVGNEIVVEVAFGDPGKLCRLAIIGPKSTIESYVTPLELRALHSALNEIIGS